MIFRSVGRSGRSGGGGGSPEALPPPSPPPERPLCSGTPLRPRRPSWRFWRPASRCGLGFFNFNLIYFEAGAVPDLRDPPPPRSRTPPPKSIAPPPPPARWWPGAAAKPAATWRRQVAPPVLLALGGRRRRVLWSAGTQRCWTKMLRRAWPLLSIFVRPPIWGPVPAAPDPRARPAPRGGWAEGAAARGRNKRPRAVVGLTVGAAASRQR